MTIWPGYYLAAHVCFVEHDSSTVGRGSTKLNCRSDEQSGGGPAGLVAAWEVRLGGFRGFWEGFQRFFFFWGGEFCKVVI